MSTSTVRSTLTIEEFREMDEVTLARRVRDGLVRLGLVRPDGSLILPLHEALTELLGVAVTGPGANLVQQVTSAFGTAGVCTSLEPIKFDVADISEPDLIRGLDDRLTKLAERADRATALLHQLRQRFSAPAIVEACVVFEAVVDAVGEADAAKALADLLMFLRSRSVI